MFLLLSEHTEKLLLNVLINHYDACKLSSGSLGTHQEVGTRAVNGRNQNPV